MSRRTILNFAMIVFTLASSLGESLHALPGLAHADESAVCQVRTDHMEAPAEDHHEDCPICQSTAPYQSITSEAADSLTIECCRANLPGDSIDFVTDRFEALSARAPPLS